MNYGFKVIIEGDYACFTRPEMKVERVSYDVPTPGAMEGLLKSVYWKPAIRYVIDKIIVFRPINFVNIRRNEVKENLSMSAVRKQMYDPMEDISIYTSECRHQRAAMVLKNVKYGVEFHFELTGLRCDDEGEGEKKHYNIIKRRLENGQYFHKPCLGCSEFPIKSITLTESFDMEQIDGQILAMGDTDLGFMLYRMYFKDGGKPENEDWDNPKYSDMAQAKYYRPHIIGGVIDVARYAEGMLC
jgi:CRISPR-associated protein Cas5d